MKEDTAKLVRISKEAYEALYELKHKNRSSFIKEVDRLLKIK